MGVVCKLDIGKTFDCYQVKVLFLFLFLFLFFLWAIKFIDTEKKALHRFYRQLNL